ncbi:HPF/RaiA family ribosome-associated protein [Actimicrobium antarcticum]|uniref:HPF/RaiA family ribosome-associated protein n=1 Tax=Actimicrobium antarcticum TaxID=1051899 RepID=A0ABP7ST02_9BURK
MDVQMVAQEFSLTPSLRQHLERRLAFAFSHASRHVMRIVVRLRDLNGPRGGRDMVCQISVTMPGRPGMVIREVNDNMYQAIDGAVRRAAYRARMVTRRSPGSRHRMTAPDEPADQQSEQ